MRAVIFFLFVACFAWSAKPMEPLDNYNIVMVPGSSGDYNSLECSGTVDNAYDYAIKEQRKCGNLGYAVNSMGLHYNRDGSCDKYEGYNLTYWLDSAILENVSF